jgi:hypothetical protein
MPDNTMTAVAQLDVPGPPKFLLPHMKQFAAEFVTPAKTYRFSFDEALKRSRTDALSMRRDGHILSLLQARYLPVLGADWHVKAEEDQFKEQASTYQKLIEKTPRLLQLRKCLLEAVWFGRYGVQFAFGKVKVGDKEMTGITAWKPVNGDKINFTEDMVPTIRVHATWAERLVAEGARLEDVPATSYNDQGRVLVLDKPAYRQKFAIHVHEIEDADFSEPELAGGVGGVGLRHYCYWIWWLRQEIMEWLLSYLEMMGAGGLTIVGYDSSNTNGLSKAKEAFAERATVVYLPIPPGAEKQTNIVQRIEPSGTGNDIFQGWIDGYFNAILTRLIIGQDLSSKSGPTGLGSGVADLQENVKQCIHRYDAKNLNETETQQILDTLISLNEPSSNYGLKCETVLKSPNSSEELAAAKQAFDMGAEVAESHVLKLASIPEVKEGEKVLSLAQQQATQAALEPQPAPDGDAEATEDHGMTLEEMRHHLTDQGIPDEEQLHHIADMVEAGELEELDAQGGVQYVEAQEQPKTYAREDWTEEQGPNGGDRWRNTKTGTIQYKAPGDKRPVQDGKAEPEPRGGDTKVGTLRKGLVTQGAYQSLDRAMRGESNKTLQGEGVLKHVMDADKRMLKAQVISLAGQHGMPIDSKTSKTRALAFIEDTLRKHQGKSDGNEYSVPADNNAQRSVYGAGAKTSDSGDASDSGKAGTGTGATAVRAEPKPGATGATGPSSTEPTQAGGNPKDPAPMKSDVFAKGIESSDLTAKMKETYGQTARDVHARLPKAAQERFEKHVSSVTFHESPDVLSQRMIESEASRFPFTGKDKEKLKKRLHKSLLGGGRAAGAYHRGDQLLWLNGGGSIDGKKVMADHIYAHEFTHAIDGPDHEYSKTTEWKSAWKEEGHKVSNYATRSTQEGFAEFGRLVYAGGLSGDQLSERYPKMMEHWQGLGLLPDGMTQSTAKLAEGDKPQMPDVFEGPIVTEDTIGDKALARRGAGETLKDFLTGIGGSKAHGDIVAQAKSTHGIEKEQVDQHNAGVRYAGDLLQKYGGKKFDKSHEAFKTGDMTQLPRFDEIADSVDTEHPGLLQGEDKSQSLYERMKEGIKPQPDMREHEDKAVQDWHDAGRPGTVTEGEAGEPENADTSFDFGSNAVRGGHEDQGSSDRRGSGGDNASDGGFMEKEAAGPHSADDMPSYAGQSFTNDQGATVEVRQSAEGTWSVGGKSGLSAAAAASVLNSLKAVKAQSLLPDEATAQKPIDKPKEKLEWAPPVKAKELPDLPGMKDVHAPGMFGDAYERLHKKLNMEDHHFPTVRKRKAGAK